MTALRTPLSSWPSYPETRLVTILDRLVTPSSCLGSGGSIASPTRLCDVWQFAAKAQTAMPLQLVLVASQPAAMGDRLTLD